MTCEKCDEHLTGTMGIMDRKANKKAAFHFTYDKNNRNRREKKEKKRLLTPGLLHCSFKSYYGCKQHDGCKY